MQSSSPSAAAREFFCSSVRVGEVTRLYGYLPVVSIVPWKSPHSCALEYSKSAAVVPPQPQSASLDCTQPVMLSWSVKSKRS